MGYGVWYNGYGPKFSSYFVNGILLSEALNFRIFDTTHNPDYRPPQVGERVSSIQFSLSVSATQPLTFYLTESHSIKAELQLTPRGRMLSSEWQDSGARWYQWWRIRSTGNDR
ncbi:abc transporter [Moniliophthora roreri]|nr:abc transporter [Moniliophthora roreri]